MTCQTHSMRARVGWDKERGKGGGAGCFATIGSGVEAVVRGVCCDAQ